VIVCCSVSTCNIYVKRYNVHVFNFAR